MRGEEVVWRPYLEMRGEVLRIVPGDFIPAEVVCQQDDDVRLAGPLQSDQSCQTCEEQAGGPDHPLPPSLQQLNRRQKTRK